MKKIIRANYVDIVGRKTLYAEITFSRTITEIKVLDEKPRDGEPYCMPGFVDSHVHIESSMLTPQRFATMVIPHGTMGVVCDPHEITNVLGLAGVEYMMADAEKSPLNFFFAIPSCVPATSFETCGAEFGVKEIEKVISRSVALAELMNYPGVVFGYHDVLAKVELAKKHNRPIDGHIPGITDERLAKYVAAGISTDHESFSLDEAQAKIALGMKILIREGSAARNLEALAPLFLSNIDDIMVCTDDAHPDDIRDRGHIEKFYHKALALGLSLYDIYKPLLLNPIAHYKLKVGRLQKGDSADFIVVDNPQSLNIRESYIAGTKVYDGTNLTYKTSHSKRPNSFIDRQFTTDEFRLFSKGEDYVQHVIGLIPDQLITEHLLWSPNLPKGAEVCSDDAQDIVKICVINRYRNAPVVCGLIKGTGLKRGAMASSIAHDSHNVVVIGRDAESMKHVSETMFRMKGGIVVYDGEGRTDKLRLPIGGIMVANKWESVASKYEKLITLAQTRCGTTLKSPFMSMAFMCLLVIPSLKIGDKGLFNVDKFGLIE